MKKLLFVLTIIGTLIFSFGVIDSSANSYEDLIYTVNESCITISACNHSAISIEIPREIDGYPVVSIGPSAFEYCTELKYITIPDSVTNIDFYAFKHCENLTSIEIPSSVTNIGSSAFVNCYNLAEVTIGDNVISIGESAFEFCTSLTSVIIPDSVINIGNSAFNGCTGLISIKIPNSVTSIGDSAFTNCRNLTNITIGDSVTTIGDGAFYNCCNLTSISIPDSVISIESGAFRGCTGLIGVFITDLTAWCNIVFGEDYANPLLYGENLYLNNSLVSNLEMPNTVTEIKPYAFYGCKSLTSITIPNSIKSIGVSAFRGCSNLINVYISNMEVWCNIDFGNSSANPLSYATNLYLTNEIVKYIVVPDAIAEIKPYTFYGYCNLTNILIPNSVKNIGNSAFEGCSSLTSLDIPDSVTSIGAYAFEWCNNLTSITIPNSVTSIGDYAFSYCENLTNVTIPDSVIAIGKSAFESCGGLTSITISNNITSISEDVFNSCYNLTSINIPHSITNIGTSAFENCTNLTSIVIPNNVNSIGAAAFRGCNNLTSLTLSDSVTNISSALFEECSSLTNITIPKSVTIIGNSAFEGCSSLTSLDIPDSVTSIGESVFEDCKSLKSITIPNGITNIEYHTFYYCTGLTNVKIPKSVTSIGNSAFSYCNSLTDVFYLGSEADWNKISKSYSGLEPEQIHYAEAIEIYTIVYNVNGGNGAPESQSKNEGEDIILSTVQPVRDGYSFLGWATTSDAKEPEYFSGAWFDIDSDTVLYAVWKDINDTTIASGVCGDLTWALDEEGSLTISGSGNMGNYYYYPSTAPWYLNRLSIKRIIIGDGVKSIGDYAFYGCGNLSCVKIGSNVVNIGENAFSDCSSLSDIYISDNTYKIANTAFNNTAWYNKQPDGIVYVGNVVYGYKGEMSADTTIDLSNAIGITEYAFSDCENLSELIIGENVKHIGSYAFKNCTNLKTVKYNAVNCYYSDGGYSVEESEQFSGCDGLEDVTIGNKVIFIPSNMFSNCTNIKNVYIGDSVEVIGGAFTNCTQIKEFNIPKSVKYIWQYAFPVISELENIYYEGTEEDWNKISIQYIVPAAWTINTNTCLQDATKHYNCVLEKALEIVSDKYNGKLKINFSMDNSECILKISSLTDDFNTDEIKLYVACYGENGEFIGFEECNTTDKEKSRIYNFSLPTSKYKIMLWNNNCCPLINAIE